MPTIDIPSFNGEFTKWRSFLDTFTALVHGNKFLSNVQKLCYLRSSLTGDALNTIASLETTSDNSSIAFDILKEKFNYTRKIIYSHVKEIINLKCTTLAALVNCVEQNLRSLQNLKIEIEKWDVILVPLILSKIDFRLIRERDNYVHIQFTKDKIPTWKELMKFLIDRSDSASSSRLFNMPQPTKFKTNSFVTTFKDRDGPL